MSKISQTNNHFFTAETKKSYKKLLAVMVIIVIIVSIAVLLNTIYLQTVAEKSTRNYVQDVSRQLVLDINFRLEIAVNELEMIKDSLLEVEPLHNSEEETRKFLEQKEKFLDFSALAVVGDDGTGEYTDGVNRNIRGSEAFSKALQGRISTDFLGEQQLLYMIPLEKDNADSAVLAGIRSKESMQSIVDTESFDGEGLSCIVDQEGKLLISPTDAKPFRMIEDLFQRDEDEALSKEIDSMLHDMKKKESGVISFPAADDIDLLMAYHALNPEGWYLLTLVPADLLSQETAQYALQTIVIIIGIFFAFFLTLFSLFYIYGKYQAQLEHIAFVDPVTGGMNNANFQFECERRLRSAPPGTYTLIALNIKNFKLINENFGTHEGDGTLRYVMRKLERNIFEGELAARGEADHYFLLLKSTDQYRIKQRMENLVRDINDFNKQREEPYYLTVLRGAYIVDEPDLEITVIQDRANTACRNRLHHDEGTCVFYDIEFTRRLQKERRLNDSFESSLENGEFQVYLQPKVRLSDGKIGGAEALVRWKTPEGELISPGEFIPVFEKSGHICKLDLYMFEAVCGLICKWRKMGLKLVPVSVNISRQHFQNPEFLQQYKQVAEKYQIPDGAIEMEMTESIFFDEDAIENVSVAIDEMHKLGFSCSLDDFGAGYSSLGLLKAFHVDVIKLDRSFFLGREQKRAGDVVEAIIQLSKKLEIHTVAEGIEEQDQLYFLHEAGCDMVQGYIFSKPLPAEEFQTWMQAHL